ncbi:hypothetical protein ABZV77_11510 [Streptomyces sp. NPDC004732]|uniref:hypothetical protein n=1 Tax=Streptomyces sp. NPDC004732 TaxID=3154290 RepID=UPI0033AA9691
MNATAVTTQTESILDRYPYGMRAWDLIDWLGEETGGEWALVLDGTDEPLEDCTDNELNGHTCQAAIHHSNFNQAFYLMRESSGDGHGHDTDKVVQWGEYIVYRSDVDSLRECAEEISRALSDYPMLDDMRCSELEDEYLHENLSSWECRNLPDGVDVGDVIEWGHDMGLSSCTGCSSWDADEILGSQGYEPCSDCNDYVTPGDCRTGEPLCAECAEFYVRGEDVEPDVYDRYVRDYATNQGAAYRADLDALIDGEPLDMAVRRAYAEAFRKELEAAGQMTLI